MVAALAFAGAAHAQTSPAPAPTDPARPAMASQEPVALFKAVCIGGRASLSPKWARSTRYKELPAGAKAVIGLTDDQVPNPAFQIGGINKYLILPAPAPGPKYANNCAVVWEGTNLAEAQKLVPLAPAHATISATALKGWVLLQSTPKVPAPSIAPAPAQ